MSPPAIPPPGKGHGCNFWLILIALCSLTFLEALDFTTMSAVLLTIVNELKGADKFTWISAAYMLFLTTFQPLTGALADVLSHCPCVLASLCLIALGSALCGAAQNMDMLIAGRS
ncbi:MFS general substrate transporter, partial [Ramaria rubella]